MIVGMASETGNPQHAADHRLTIQNRLAEIATVTDALDSFAAANSVPETITWRFQLALEELLRNIVAHAYADSNEHEIEIRFQCDGSAFSATVADDGIPFNPLHSEAPDLSEALDEREIGGLGIHLARNVVEKMDYAWDEGKNVVTIQSAIVEP